MSKTRTTVVIRSAEVIKVIVDKHDRYNMSNRNNGRNGYNDVTLFLLDKTGFIGSVFL